MTALFALLGALFAFGIAFASVVYGSLWAGVLWAAATALGTCIGIGLARLVLR